MFSLKLVSNSTTTIAPRAINDVVINLFAPVFGTQTSSSRTICHKSKLPPKKTRHWPYEKYTWGWYNFYLDPLTTKKFDENTKIIQVEGNISSGKDEFCKQLAEELGMHYMPPVNLDDIYINKHGYDYRALNPLLPERMRVCDMEMFHESPSRHSVIHMQYNLFKMRLFQYLEALRHIFNTGQGVILNRSVFTERVFVEAMHNIGWLPMGYLRKDDVKFYDWKLRHNHIRNMTLMRIYKPHLTIYLDTPVETCLDRIKNDPDPMIANSSALTKEFLEAIVEAYDDVVLPKQEINSHVLRVDHPKPKILDEIIDVIDLIEDMDFEYDTHDTRFEDWNKRDFPLWHYKSRHAYSSMKLVDFLQPLHQPYFDIAGLGDSITDADLILRKSLVESHLGNLGYFQDYETDTRIHNPIGVFFNYMDFSKRINLLLRNDFI